MKKEGTGISKTNTEELEDVIYKQKEEQEGLHLHEEGQQEVPEEDEKNGECFEDVFKDGDMIVNKAECEPELKKKEWIGIGKTNTEELEDVIKKQKEETWTSSSRLRMELSRCSLQRCGRSWRWRS